MIIQKDTEIQETTLLILIFTLLTKLNDASCILELITTEKRTTLVSNLIEWRFGLVLLSMLFLCEYQRRFTSGRSILINSISTTKLISEVMYRSGKVDIIHTDRLNAFITLDHELLVTKFTSFSFSNYQTNKFLS